MPEPREILGDAVFSLIQNLSRRQDVPGVVIDEVFAIKQIADRVDGRIHSDTICIVLISHGYSTADNKYDFERGESPKEKPIVEVAKVIESVPATIASKTEDVKDEEKVEDVETLATKEDAPTETKTEDEVAPSPLSDIDEGPQPLAKDTKVRFAHDGKHVEGVIASSVIEDEDIFYGIDVDGFEETITKHEDDVIEIK